MQFIPRIMKTNIRLHHNIQDNKMECRRLGLSPFWCVDVLACRRFGLSTFWSVDVLVCRRFGLSTFRFVDVLVCRHFGLSTFRFVDVLVCRRFGCRRFGLSTFWPVTNDMRGQKRIPSKGISITELCIPIINSWIHIIHDNIEYSQFSYGYNYGYP